ncbi:DUF5689 domain-containing protein [Gelidibacter salicanalis]|uniref:Choice-of-anchor J domain-containing protein n=1 Tax=Gelidibacter salicanalis TaxID=291193 RepID=A0A934KQ78_9FLAO|nr:DUF5689 domain-containing protein [Gelidibacter salicanalis]MBJ7879446.1 choice-of-anchor J domain-containing protein [Gelidibacter salicanalis]
MIKTLKLTAFLSGLAVLLTVISCVQDDDFSIPEGLGVEENKGLEALLASGATEISIPELKAKYTHNNSLPVLIDTNIFIKGVVSSSDKSGNFFKEIFIQNAPENPTVGIKLIANQVESNNQYNLGREVYINLKGLYIGEERVGNGVTTIGGSTQTNNFGTTVVRLTENQRTKNIFRTATTLELTPLELTFSQVNSSHIGIYAKFSGVEFVPNLEGKRYFDPVQDFDTLRQLQSCSGTIGYSNFILETSSYADFKDVLLPTGNGIISGVVSKTYDGSKLVVALNTLSDVVMTNSRCTPLGLENFSTLFKEDFESAKHNTNLNFKGWTNFAEAGTTKWREKNIEGNGYTEFGTFGTRSPVNIAWLITPRFNMDNNSNIYLNFRAAQHHLDSPNNSLEVLVSTNYNGTNVLTATWTPIEAAIPSQSNSWYEFVDSGLINLSLYKGTFHVAFKVTGSGTDTTMDGAYQIDDVLLLTSK